jgi:predicted porin
MTSLKKLIAVLAAVLPLAGRAQTPPAAPPPLYQIYGTLNLNFQFTEMYGATNQAASVNGRTAVSTDSTNIGIKGAANVVAGLQIVYQCETYAGLDGQQPRIAATPAVLSPSGTGLLCGRNSRLGVSSPLYGTLFLGNWDTPYKAIWYGTKADDPFGNTDVFDVAGIMGSPGQSSRSNQGVTGATGADAPAGNRVNFNIRAANSVAYHSPKVMGLGVRLQYSASENADVPAGTQKPELYSVGVNYDQGPISVLAAYENHQDWLSANSSDYAIRVGAGYGLETGLGTTTLGATWEQLWYDNKATKGTAAQEKYDRQAFFVGLKHRTGMHEFRARYAMADSGDAKGGTGVKLPTNGLGAQNYALGYAFYLSNAAQVFAFWTMTENDRAASYSLGSTGGPGFLSTIPAGADPWSVGLGLRYAF